MVFMFSTAMNVYIFSDKNGSKTCKNLISNAIKNIVKITNSHYFLKQSLKFIKRKDFNHNHIS